MGSGRPSERSSVCSTYSEFSSSPSRGVRWPRSSSCGQVMYKRRTTRSLVVSGWRTRSEGSIVGVFCHSPGDVDYDNRSARVSCSLRFGVRVKQSRAAAALGRCRARDAAVTRPGGAPGPRDHGLHHRRQNRLPPLGDRQADVQADGSAARDPDLRLRRSRRSERRRILGIGGALTDASAETFAKLSAGEAAGDSRRLLRSATRASATRSGEPTSTAATSRPRSYTYVDEGDKALKSFSVDARQAIPHSVHQASDRDCRRKAHALRAARGARRRS